MKDKKDEQVQEQVQEQDNTKSELSAYKPSSELSTTLADSAYSSQGTSTYSSLASIKQPLATSYSNSYQKSQFATSRKLSSKSSKSSSNHSKTSQPNLQARPQPLASQSGDGHLNFLKEVPKTPSDREFRRRKLKPSSSSSGERVEAVEQPGFPTSQESKALKVATLSQALVYVDQFRKCQSLKVNKAKKGPEESELEDLATNLLEASQEAVPTSSGFPSSLGSDVTTLQSSQKKEGDGFCVAVSLLDGQVTHTTQSITNVLGYPKDMWVGRSFVDFIHSEDRDTFISQVTENINLSHRTFADASKNESKEAGLKSGSFFVRIRIYNGLKTGFGIKERKMQCNPFKLTVCFSEVDKEPGISSTGRSELITPTIFMFITAIPVVTAYSEPFEEGPVKLISGQSSFVTKHNSECNFSWVDDFTISFTGYLPQDMSGDEIFKYIHPEDLGIIKEAFQEVMSKLGKPTKSKPVRFKVKNGSYIKISSWWSSFINPWSRNLEFINGKHTVLQGPKQQDLFAVERKDNEIPETVFKQAMLIQNDIRWSLKRTHVAVRQVDPTISQVTKNKKDLSSFMGSLLEEVAKAESSKLGRSNTKVVIGSISPHYSDSSENPPSYNQLTYNENLTRFFNSQPKTLTERNAEQEQNVPFNETNIENSSGSIIDCKKKQKVTKDLKRLADGEQSLNDSGEQGSGEQLSGEGHGNHSSTLQTGLSAGQPQQPGDDGMLSQDGSGSGSRLGSGSRGVSSTDNFKPPPLTVELLDLHNKDMNKRMLCNFKEAKRTGETRFLKDSVRQKQPQLSDPKRGNRKDEARYKRKSEGLPVVHNASQQEGPLITQQRHPQHLTESQWIQQMKTVQSSTVPSQDYQLMSPQLLTPQGTHIQSRFIGVPAVYLPIPGVSQGFMIQQGTRYVPFGMMYSPNDLNQDSKGPGQKKGPESQPELPNCPAVNSCMVINPNPSKFKRPDSPSTSIKGEPGSAIESNTSAPHSNKEKTQMLRSPLRRNLGNESDQNIFSGSTSSSLYSFLKSSEEFHLKQSSSSDTERSLLEVAQENPKEPRPSLPEPFWNLSSQLSQEMSYKYQLPREPLETVLARDRELLACMHQPDVVDQQLGDLLAELEVGVELEEFLEDFACPPTEDENSDGDTTGIELEEKVANERRRRDHLEKMTIFMEDDAPFPDPDTSPTKAIISNIYASPKYSKDGSGSQTSENDGASSMSSSNTMPTTKKVRFGGTTPQDFRTVGIIEEGDENVVEESQNKDFDVDSDFMDESAHSKFDEDV